MTRTNRPGTSVGRLRGNPVAAGSTVLFAVLVAATQLTGVFDGVRQVVGRVFGAGQSSGARLLGSVCATPAGLAAVRAYGLALTDPRALGEFVRSNAPIFADEGDAVKCYRRLAAALAANEEVGQVEALRDRAEAERETGLRFDRGSYTNDLAETLQELADALPALARADEGPYRGTKAYDSAQAYSTLLQRAPGPSAGIAALIQADEAVLRELGERLVD